MTKKEGKGILSADQYSIYSVIGKPQLGDFEFVEIRKVDLYPIINDLIQLLVDKEVIY